MVINWQYILLLFQVDKSLPSGTALQQAYMGSIVTGFAPGSVMMVILLFFKTVQAVNGTVIEEAFMDTAALFQSEGISIDYKNINVEGIFRCINIGFLFY